MSPGQRTSMFGLLWHKRCACVSNTNHRIIRMMKFATLQSVLSVAALRLPYTLTHSLTDRVSSDRHSPWALVSSSLTDSNR